MNIVTFPLGQLQTNCYFIVEDSSCLIIDPGDSADFLLEELQRRRLKPLAILATHGHFDHIMAVGEIQLSFQIPFYIFKEDLFLVKRVKETAKYFLGFEPHVIPIKNVTELTTGTTSMGVFTFEIIPTPGHTPGSCGFYFKDEEVVFTGDTLFKEGIGDCSHAYSSKNDLNTSLQKLLLLPPETIVYPGHGEDTILANEQVGNR